MERLFFPNTLKTTWVGESMMRYRFFLKIGLVLLLLLLVHIVVPAFFAGGKTDNFYQRFTSSQQQSLILGTSRSAQGLYPESFDSLLQDMDLDGPMYNFSFTIAHSPYGPAYLRAIQAKLDPLVTNGLFIVGVDPYSIGIRKRNESDDVTQFREQGLCVANMNFFNLPVNYEYLLKNYDHFWGEILLTSLQKSSGVVLSNGRFQVDAPADSAFIRNRTINNIRNNNKTEYVFSNTRVKYLEATIDFLKTHGKVVLVRLPTGKEIKEIEDQIMPEFDFRMEALADNMDILYVSYSAVIEQYQTRDGDHLLPESGRRLSADLAKRIKIEFKEITQTY
ncbi:MAG TPA: hypothetical protein VGK59_01745 [Ohtaekwangia sp.]